MQLPCWVPNTYHQRQGLAPATELPRVTLYVHPVSCQSVLATAETRGPMFDIDHGPIISVRSFLTTVLLLPLSPPPSRPAAMPSSGVVQMVDRG
jgi:hypothetical protein